MAPRRLNETALVLRGETDFLRESLAYAAGTTPFLMLR